MASEDQRSASDANEVWEPRTSWILPSLHRNSRRVFSDVTRAARYASSATIYQQPFADNEIYRSASLQDNHRLFASDSSIESIEPRPGFWFFRLSREEKLTLLCLASVDLFSYLCMGIMAPFFPAKTEEVFAQSGTGNSTLDGSQVVSGAVFSVYALTVFVGSPIFAKLIPTVGARFIFIAGVFIAAGCNFLFGFLDDVRDPTQFTVLAIVLRFFEGCGAAAFCTASFTILAYQFPGNVPLVFGTLEAFVGLGMTIGPAVGGLLHSVGGFKLPFFVVGSLMMATVPLNMWLLPSPVHKVVKPRKGARRKFFKSFSIYVVSLTVVIMASVWGFLDPTLQPHLEQYNLNSAMIGLVFLLLSATYTIFSPIWGCIAEKTENTDAMMILGLVGGGVVLFFLGPSSFIGINPQPLWLNLVCLTLLGVFISMALIPTFESLLSSSEEAGMEDNIGTYAVVSGVWGSAYSLGEVVGPALGGWLDEYYGFEVCCTVMAGLCIATAVLFSIYIAVEQIKIIYKRRRRVLAGLPRRPSVATWRTRKPVPNTVIDRVRGTGSLNRSSSRYDEWSQIRGMEPSSVPDYGSNVLLSHPHDQLENHAFRGVPVDRVDEDIPSFALSV